MKARNLIVTLSAALLLASCGGSSEPTPTSANPGTSTPTSGQATSSSHKTYVEDVQKTTQQDLAAGNVTIKVVNDKLITTYSIDANKVKVESSNNGTKLPDRYWKLEGGSMFVYDEAGVQKNTWKVFSETACFNNVFNREYTVKSLGDAISEMSDAAIEKINNAYHFDDFNIELDLNHVCEALDLDKSLYTLDATQNKWLYSKFNVSFLDDHLQAMHLKVNNGVSVDDESHVIKAMQEAYVQTYSVTFTKFGSTSVTFPF